MPQRTAHPQCAPGECLAGYMGFPKDTVKIKSWADEYLRFQGKIELWNELTKRHAIPHIGTTEKFEFCPVCGHKIDPSVRAGSAAVIGDLVNWADHEGNLGELETIVENGRLVLAGHQEAAKRNYGE